MSELVDEIETVLLRANLGSPWDGNMKVFGEVSLSCCSEISQKKTGMPVRISKSDYHFLVEYVEPDEIDPEVISVLDTIAEIAAEASQIS